MKTAFITSECVPYVKTGGLADVSGSLPKALAELGIEVKIFLPLYSGIKKEVHNIEPVDDLQNITVKTGDRENTYGVYHTKHFDTGIDVYFIDCPEYFGRDMPYTDDPDEDERFILFQIAVIETFQRLKWAPDVVHCNDWQSSLIPAYLKINYKWDKLFEKTRFLLSIHNIGYQGRFPQKSFVNSGLPSENFYAGGPFELNGSFCFLKAGILFSEIISTVSPTYALEIQTGEYGAGMENILASRKDDLYGILNGIDTGIWNPVKDKFIPRGYSTKNVSEKYVNKKKLLEEAELDYNEDIPVIGIVSRFTGQKGFELLIPIIDQIMQLPLQFLVLGSGEEKYENFFREVARTYPHKANVYIGYSNKLAHFITAGCDMFLMPSKYEPCGLNQMYSLNYGTVPIIRKTGGLADTVKDYHEFDNEGNGFSFTDYSPYAIYLTIERALKMFEDKEVWRNIMIRGMKEDFSWKSSAEKYAEMYEKAKDY
jgi:starch synthase